MPFDDYLAQQQKNLDQVTQLRVFKALVPPIDVLYERSLALRDGQSELYEPLLVICYKAFLSAASLIGRAQPEDTLAITRRAIEGACLGRAIKHDPQNAVRWLAYQDRVTRQEILLRRAMSLPRSDPEPKSGRRVPRLPFVPDPPGHGTVRYLRMMHSLLSERAVHFTPTFLRTQASPVKGPAEHDDPEYIDYQMAWFERSQRAIEVELIGLAVAHTKILDLLDECFEGALSRDEAWTWGRKAVGAIARKLGADLGFDRIAEEFERRMTAEGMEGGDAP